LLNFDVRHQKMTTRNCFRLLLGFATALLFITAASNSRAAVNSAASACGVEDARPPQQVFADPDSKQRWSEYPGVMDVPDLPNDSEANYAASWTGSEGKVLIMMQGDGEDFGSYTHYCFGKTGELLSLKFELRTAWGWGFREEGPVHNGVLKANVAEFFETTNEKRIRRPRDASAIPEALKPTIYKQLRRLPFANLIQK
jgi:hypothetical protein